MDNSKPWPSPPEYPEDLFSGTAEHYLRHRLPYPDRLIQDLVARAKISGSGALLDLACGPGRVTLPLAPYFREVWAVDLEPDMIRVGEEEGRRRGLEDIRWMVGRAEDIDVPKGHFELTTIGEAFHRLDQKKIAERVSGWLAPQAWLAILWYENIGRSNEEWQRIAREVVGRWRRPAHGGVSQPSMNFEEVLHASGYTDIQVCEFSSSHVWTLDELVGYYYSGSRTSKLALGEDAKSFESDLRSALLAYDKSAKYSETSKFGYILARCPVNRVHNSC